MTTNTSGAQVSKVAYFPFGGQRSMTGTLDTDKKFTGQRLDQTGLYFYNARYYDATIGRFISPDSVIPNPANPQSLNRYSYCLNNPLRYIDPSGHDPDEVWQSDTGLTWARTGDTWSVYDPSAPDWANTMSQSEASAYVNSNASVTNTITITDGWLLRNDPTLYIMNADVVAEGKIEITADIQRQGNTATVSLSILVGVDYGETNFKAAPSAWIDYQHARDQDIYLDIQTGPSIDRSLGCDEQARWSDTFTVDITKSKNAEINVRMGGYLTDSYDIEHPANLVPQPWEWEINVVTGKTYHHNRGPWTMYVF